MLISGDFRLLNLGIYRNLLGFCWDLIITSNHYGHARVGKHATPWYSQNANFSRKIIIDHQTCGVPFFQTDQIGEWNEQTWEYNEELNIKKNTNAIFVYG